MATKEKAKVGKVEVVITANAVILRTGNRKNEVRRFARGTRLSFKADDSRLTLLLRTKSAARTDTDKKIVRATVKTVTRAMGAQDDPVEAPAQDVLPITATSDQVEAVK